MTVEAIPLRHRPQLPRHSTPAPRTTCSSTSTAVAGPTTRSRRPRDRRRVPHAVRPGRGSIVQTIIVEAAEAAARAGHRRDSASATCTRASWTPTPSSGAASQPIADELADGRRRRRRRRAGRACSARCSAPGSAAASAHYVDTDAKDSDPLPRAPQPVRHRPARRVVLPRRRSTPRSSRPTRATSRRMFALASAAPDDRRRHRRAHCRRWRPSSPPAHWDVVKRRDAELTYNLRHLRRAADRGAGLRLGRLGRRPRRARPEAFAELVVRQPDFLTAFAALWAARTSRTGRRGRAGR